MVQPVPSAEEFLAFGRQALASQPFSQLLGAELTALQPGLVELQLPLTVQLQQQHGFAHGGVLSYLADNALTFAGGTAMRVPVVTAEFKINYLRPGVGERLIARARAVHVGRSQAVCSCEVFALQDGAEKLCALAQGTIAALPEKATP
ncbi:PaaI family thioesterase [Pseudorhodoferax sp. LjRoot39]|uniref:PaaI family thioesterase n=1 Tax=Pseudorhodoferax sp. LjRoot39 TaxID=3342328 RepID=UPI003ECEEDB6